MQRLNTACLAVFGSVAAIIQPPTCTTHWGKYPHNHKGGGLIVLIRQLQAITLYVCSFQMIFSHSPYGQGGRHVGFQPLALGFLLEGKPVHITIALPVDMCVYIFTILTASTCPLYSYKTVPSLQVFAYMQQRLQQAPVLHHVAWHSAAQNLLSAPWLVECWQLEKKGMYTANPVMENSETFELFLKDIASILPLQSVKVHCKSEGLSIIEGLDIDSMSARVNIKRCLHFCAGLKALVTA